MKASTAWTPADKFEDLNSWDDSLKSSEIVKEMIRNALMGDLKDEEGPPPNDDVNDQDVNVCKASEKVPVLLEDVENRVDKGWKGLVTTMNACGYFHAFDSCINSSIINNSPSGEEPEQSTSSSNASGNGSSSPQSNLKYHQQIHSNTKPFTCTICGKTFTQNGHLKRHLFTHTKEKPHKCEHCQKSFTEKGSLNRHIRTHNNFGPFHCNLCDKSFNYRTHLEVHRRVHNNLKPFTCSTCGKSFRQSSHLKTHLLTHTKEKPHKCNYCGKCFRTKGNLKVHIRIHSGERPFSCLLEFCGKTFTELTNRNKHSQHCTSTATVVGDS